MKKLLAVTIMILFISVSVIPSTGTADVKQIIMPTTSGNNLYVGGNGTGNYTKIQDAIDDASDGDTVFVYNDSSPYTETLVINVSINLIGEDRDTTVIDGLHKRIIIEVISDGVLITNFSIISDNGWDSGISVHDSKNIEICYNYLKPYSYDNILIINSEFIKIHHNIIRSGADGITMEDSKFINISNNEIFHHFDGIDIGESSFINISSNYIHDNNWGLSCDYSYEINIIYNNFSNNEIGINNEFSFTTAFNYNNIINSPSTFWSTFISSFLPMPLRTMLSNSWNYNYWGKARTYPMPIVGVLTYGMLPWIVFDWHPASEPYDIGV
ncbi:nitrous oxidase accessory protein [Thermoplasmatales archaeon SCGC AB-540-F20]|nr:nitrous oxidase accessory protein [Thermoplasmatales archaeon SCGC AB-540-F20]